MAYTPLQWMGPELVNSGLVRNEAWVEEHCARALKLYPNQGVHVGATLLTALHPRALEYLEQAPIVLFGASFDSSWRRQQERAYIAQRFGPLIERGVRLRDLMASYKLPMPLRKSRPRTSIRASGRY